MRYLALVDSHCFVSDAIHSKVLMYSFTQELDQLGMQP